MTGPAWLVTLTSTVALVLVLAILLASWRLVRGPTRADRTVALDLITVLGTGLASVLALLADSSFYLDVALALALVGFLGTVALARYIAVRTGEVSDRERGRRDD
jgi:multicomponent Na+:H+ antiporter subunit F